MKNLNYLKPHRVKQFGDGDEHNGAFNLKLKGSNLPFMVIASDGDGWDHVSVSTANRVPRWQEMNEIKEMFFEPEEVVFQLHPAKSNYINIHPYTVHLWVQSSRPEGRE